jgi:hypothetical protein
VLVVTDGASVAKWLELYILVQRFREALAQRGIRIERKVEDL